ncbi:MAG: phage portal protein, partial [Pseudothermotoga sp.]
MLNSLDFLNRDQSWPPKDKDTVARLERYEQNAALFRGDHQEVFTEWPKLVREDMKASLEIILNWPKRLSTLWADLLLGEPPRISTDDKVGQNFIDELNQDNKLIQTAYEVVLDISRFGEGLFKARKQDGRSIVEGQYPALWFPVVSRDNIRDFKAHVLGWTFEQDEKKYLRIEIHTKGQIEHRVYRLEGSSIQEQLELSEFYTGLPEKEPT